MILNELVETFFEYRTVMCSDMEVDMNVLKQSDVALPFVLLIIKLAIRDTELESSVVSFDLVKQTQSLCFLLAENIHLKDERCALNIIKKLGGYRAVNQLSCVDDTIQIEKLVEQCRHFLQEVEEGKHIQVNSDLYKTFSGLFSVKLDKSFVKSELDMMNDENYLNLTEDVKLGQTNQSFKVRQHFFELEPDAQQLMEEISVLTSALYISSNQKSVVQSIKPAELPTVGYTALLAAILAIPSVLQALAIQLKCHSHQLIMPRVVYQCRQTLKNAAVTRSFTADNDSSKNWYQVAKSYVGDLQFEHSIQACLDAAFGNGELSFSEFIEALLETKSDVIIELLELNKQSNQFIKTALSIKKIAANLNDKVIGQSAAIESLSQGYLASSISPSEGPRTIYTFLGPSGVGKTYLASTFCKVMNEYEQLGYVFTNFNMEQYSNEMDSLRLFGSGIQYTDASLGVLTSSVRAQPRQVLLFDEIEKAHSSVIQSLLSVLDKGKGQDQTSQEAVDFTQCIIIFTTNLGQDIVEKNSQAHQINVFDVLRNSENPDSKVKLSYEFINRLAKGYSVLFSPLKTNHLIRLAERELTKRDDFEEQLKFCWPENFASFFLQALSPEVNPRRINHYLPKLKSSIVSKTTDLIDSTQTQLEFVIEVDEANKTESRQTKFLLIDDDSRVYGNLSEIVSLNLISLSNSIEDMQVTLEKHSPDALLIDIDFINCSGTSLTDFTNSINKINPSLPLFSYQIYHGQPTKELALSKNHDIREHFSLSGITIENELDKMLERVSYYIVMEQTLRSMSRRNEKLEYHCSTSLNEGVFKICFNQSYRTQLIHSADLKESDLFTHSLPENTLDDVIGLDRAKQRLSEVVGWLKSPDKLKNFGVKLPSGFLFAGPPGTGKTLLAKALAGECGLPFFSITASELSDRYAGGTTANIKKLFATARKYAPAIVFIDEIDALAAQRTTNSDSLSRDKNLTVNALLTEMDGFTPHDEPIFVLAATNHPQILDKAITRPGRFDETIYCDLPNKKARQTFFERFAEKHHIDWRQSDLMQLVSSAQGMSSADIEQVLREAIYQAVSDDKALTTEHIKQSMIRIVYGAPSEQIVLSQEEKRRTAYHEAAHLLAYKLLFPKQRIDFVTIEPRNQSLGFVSTRASDEYESYSKRTVMDKLQVLLAGRVAEKLCTGSIDEVSTGASNDIEKATQLAMHAIYEGGIEPSIGPVNVALITRFEESELLSDAQLAVKQWLEQAEQQVENLLNEHNQQLAMVAETLLDKESLLGNEIEQLFYE
jgi:cell division protease FtsH